MGKNFEPFDPSKVIEEKNKRRDVLRLKLAQEAQEKKAKEAKKEAVEKTDPIKSEEIISQEAIDKLLAEEFSGDKEPDSRKDVSQLDGLITPEDMDELLKTYKAEDGRTNIEGEKFNDASNKTVENHDRAWELDKSKEKDSEFERLLLEVERTRKAYAKKDYEVTNVVARLKKILGGNFRSGSGDFQDTLPYANQYKISLNSLLEYQAEKLKEKNSGDSQLNEGAEIDELMKYFSQDEKTNLFAARTSARAEVWEEKFGKKPGYVLEKGSKFINWYRKVGWKKKMVVSGALIGVGLVGGVAGATSVVAAVSAAKVGQRILGGVMTGMGASGMLEAKYRKKENEKFLKKRKDIREDLDVTESSEELYETLIGKMRSEIDAYDKDLKNEKDQARKRKFLGATFGLVVGSFAGQAMHNISDATGLTDALKVAKEFWFGKAEEIVAGASDIHGVKPDVSDIKNNTSAVDRVSGISKEKLSSVAKEAVKIVGASETVGKGDSVWRMLERQVDEKFGNFSSERKTYIIDAFKDKIAENPKAFGLENVNDVKVGQQINFSELFENEKDVQKILDNAKNLTSKQIENIANNNSKLQGFSGGDSEKFIPGSGEKERIFSKVKVEDGSLEGNNPKEIGGNLKEIEVTKKGINGNYDNSATGKDIPLDTQGQKPSTISKNPNFNENSVSKNEEALTPKSEKLSPVRNEMSIESLSRRGKEVYEMAIQKMKELSSSYIMSDSNLKQRLVEQLDVISNHSKDVSVFYDEAKDKIYLRGSYPYYKEGDIVRKFMIEYDPKTNNIIKFENIVDIKSQNNPDLSKGGLAASVIGGIGFFGKEKLGKLSLREREKMENIFRVYGFDKKDNFFSRAKKVMQKISLGRSEFWGDIKDLKFPELKKSTNDLRLIRSVESAEKDFGALLGKSAKHRRGETVKKWLSRMIDESLKKEKIEDEQKQAA